MFTPPDVERSCCVTGDETFSVGGLDPSCNLGSSSGQMGAMPLFLQADLRMVGGVGMGDVDVGSSVGLLGTSLSSSPLAFGVSWGSADLCPSPGSPVFAPGVLEPSSSLSKSTVICSLASTSSHSTFRDSINCQRSLL